MGPGPGGPGRRGPRATGKPKNLGAAVKRLLGYVGNYKWLFLVVLLCMLLNTVFTLLGTYIMAPII